MGIKSLLYQFWVYFTTFESLIVYRTLVGHIMCLKWLVAATFESSGPLHLLKLGMSMPSLHRESTDSLVPHFQYFE